MRFSLINQEPLLVNTESIHRLGKDIKVVGLYTFRIIIEK